MSQIAGTDNFAAQRTAFTQLVQQSAAAGSASSTQGELARPNTTATPRMVEPVSQALLAAHTISPATMSSMVSGA